MSSRKRSPNAPAFALRDAVSKALAVYDKEQLHAVHANVLAEDLGYSNAKTGSSARAISTLRSFGLVHSPSPGMLAITKDIEDYKYCPDEAHKSSLLKKWVSGPKQFEKLILQYPDSAPSDAALKYDLIRDGFSESSAKQVVRDFKDSVAFANLYGNNKQSQADQVASFEETRVDISSSNPNEESSISRQAPSAQRTPIRPQAQHQELIRIPVRLSEGRKAWVEIPEPFFEKDKEIIIKQIELIFADDDLETN